jgi:hypothetical protein
MIGSWIVGGGASTMSVNNTGTPVGGGVIVGDAFAVGRVEPDGSTALLRDGPAPGTLTVAGDYGQIDVVPGAGTESGSLYIDVAGTGAGQ